MAVRFEDATLRIDERNTRAVDDETGPEIVGGQDSTGAHALKVLDRGEPQADVRQGVTHGGIQSAETRITARSPG